jgi:hypothetical protein
LDRRRARAMKPAARTTGLVIRDVGGETVVYDVERHEAHCLNRTAALVFRHADGTRSLPELAAVLASESGSCMDGQAVRLALEQLAGANLLEGRNAQRGPDPPLASAGRRQAMLRVGLGAAFLAPVVTSLLVPTPAEAAGTCIPQAACTPAKYGQDCYVLSKAECGTKICMDNNLCQ